MMPWALINTLLSWGMGLPSKISAFQTSHSDHILLSFYHHYHWIKRICLLVASSSSLDPMVSLPTHCPSQEHLYILMPPSPILLLLLPCHPPVSALRTNPWRLYIKSRTCCQELYFSIHPMYSGILRVDSESTQKSLLWLFLAIKWHVLHDYSKFNASTTPLFTTPCPTAIWLISSSVSLEQLSPQPLIIPCSPSPKNTNIGLGTRKPFLASSLLPPSIEAGRVDSHLSASLVHKRDHLVHF